MSPSWLRPGRRRALQQRIGALEQRLRTRRATLRDRADALDQSLRAAITSPLALLLAGATGFVAARHFADVRRARSARLGVHRPWRPLLLASVDQLRAHGRAWLWRQWALLFVAASVAGPSSAPPAADRGRMLPWSTALAAVALIVLGAGLTGLVTTVDWGGWVGLLILLAVVGTLLWATRAPRRS
jgi:hypothetical protein